MGIWLRFCWPLVTRESGGLSGWRLMPSCILPNMTRGVLVAMAGGSGSMGEVEMVSKTVDDRCVYFRVFLFSHCRR